MSHRIVVVVTLAVLGAVSVPVHAQTPSPYLRTAVGVAIGPGGVSLGISTPGVSIGINVPSYPQLAPVPGLPVYYAPALAANYFFYDGMFWAYWRNSWYASTWYNGPWSVVEPIAVPAFLLRVPVRYYRQPPGFFHGWSEHEPPRWGERWGPAWSQNREGWERWNRAAPPPSAPLPQYQRNYPQGRYPGGEDQHLIRNRNYGYQPQEPAVRQHFEQGGDPGLPPGQARHDGSPPRGQGDRGPGEHGPGERGRR